nr:MAG TPA: hypothetical protein [Caudoviricetes sp.]
MPYLQNILYTDWRILSRKLSAFYHFAIKRFFYAYF